MRHLIIVSFVAAFVLFTALSYALDSNNSEKYSQKNNLLLANAPPGLKKQGVTHTPSFLGNTPLGWDEGLKKGWNKDKDWRWDKKNKSWENKNWRWDETTKHWQKSKD